MKVKVIEPFRDKVTKQEYKVGQVVSFDDEARVADMVERELAEIVAELTVEVLDAFKQVERNTLNEALKLVGVQGNISAMKEETVLKKIQELPIEALGALKRALNIEL